MTAAAGQPVWRPAPTPSAAPPPVPPRPIPVHRRRRTLWVSIVVLVLIPVVVPWITLPRLRNRVVRSLQADLGRTVRANAVHLQLFPRPGVELDGLEIGDDPAFGLEDMVQADEASAALELWPLLHGRLVWARISLSHAHINLVRNSQGRWNIAAFLQRGASPSPTSGTVAAARAAPAAPTPFPYLEWSDTRVNFKLEEIKTCFYLDQVEGSLAREPSAWHLQARFQPERTDLNLSNTGEVTLDGRWSPRGGGFRQAPFDLTLGLSNSYLAGSSALLAGRDAGVHGIVSARLHLYGTAAKFRIAGRIQAFALRRWDLLPPPAQVSADVAGVYFPSQDRFVLTGAGDPGWQHLRVSGEITNLFSRPNARLNLELHQLPAANFLPLALALKAGLPAGLRADGIANGRADLLWQNGHASGTGQIHLDRVRLNDDQSQLRLPAATLLWDGHQLRLPATPATVGRARAAGVPLALAAAADLTGFQLQLDSPAFDPRAAAALGHLFGVASPWPAGLAGAAQVRLALASPWSEFRQAQWTGSANFRLARFRPANGPALAVRRLSLAFNPGQPPRATFTYDLPGLGGGPVTGSLQASTSASPRVQFALRAGRISSPAIVRWLQPSPPGFVQRVFGASAPGWLSRLQASGSLAVSDLDWHGIHSRVAMDLTAAPGEWRASQISLALAQGLFRGSGSLSQGRLEITGGVPASRPLSLVQLLQPTPYLAMADGSLSGTLRLQRPAAAIGWLGLDAAGNLLIENGDLATSQGAFAFDRLAFAYTLRNRRAVLTSVVCLANGTRWLGQGTAALDAAGQLSFDLILTHQGEVLHLESPAPSTP